LVSDIPTGDGKLAILFYSVTLIEKQQGTKKEQKRHSIGDEKERGEGAGSVKKKGCGCRGKKRRV
jgi:hypothetical protein